MIDAFLNLATEQGIEFKASLKKLYSEKVV